MNTKEDKSFTESEAVQKLRGLHRESDKNAGVATFEFLRKGYADSLQAICDESYDSASALDKILKREFKRIWKGADSDWRVTGHESNVSCVIRYLVVHGEHTFDDVLSMTLTEARTTKAALVAAKRTKPEKPESKPKSKPKSKPEPVNVPWLRDLRNVEAMCAELSARDGGKALAKINTTVHMHCASLMKALREALGD